MIFLRPLIDLLPLQIFSGRILFLFFILKPGYHSSARPRIGLGSWTLIPWISEAQNRAEFPCTPRATGPLWYGAKEVTVVLSNRTKGVQEHGTTVARSLRFVNSWIHASTPAQTNRKQHSPVFFYITYSSNLGFRGRTCS